MVGHGHLLSLYSSSNASRIKRLTANLPISATRRYTQEKKESNSDHVVEERAPSTAEEFKRVAQEKAHQGFTSQTAEKAQDAAGEAAAGDSNLESVKEAHEENPGGGDVRKMGTRDGQEVGGM